MATAAAHHRHGPHYDPLRHMEGVSVRSLLRDSPRASALAAAALLVPLGGGLLALSGLVLLATLAGAAPLLVLCSPVLVPAALGAALAVAALLASGALALAGVSALVWIARYAVGMSGGGGKGGVVGMVVQPLDDGETKRRGGVEGAAFVGHRLRDAAGDGMDIKVASVRA